MTKVIGYLMIGIAELLSLGFVATCATPRWSGQDCRVLVRVEPDDIGDRAFDERPAEVKMDFALLLQQQGISRTPDLTTLRVEKYDPETGETLAYDRYAYAQGPAERPFRWYDAAIPYEFPEFEANINRTNGVFSWTPHARWGYFYNVIGDWQRGRLCWLHTQRGNAPSYYMISFNLLPKGDVPQVVPPRGFMGDGTNRCDLKGGSSTGLIHSRVTVDDWNGDGLLDLIVGCARGGVVWYPNTGSNTKPSFPYSKMLFFSNGKPLDIGWSAAPLVVDWDGDGVKDLLVGAEWNRIVFIRNEGSNTNRKLVYKKLLKADGKTLALPHEPVPEIPGVYKTDYYPILEVVDWDGDGAPDLLAGGYVTGRIFLYENMGTSADGTPILSFRDALHADGEILDVGWTAAPTAADFDGDGDFDLIVGNMPMTEGGGDSASSENFLQYFENVGSRTQPQLKKRPFPQKGTFPTASLGTPRATDWNGDGLLDLVVSSGTSIYLYRNIGTRTAPKFEAHRNALPSQWGAAPLPGPQFLDWDGDGHMDIASGFNVYRNTGRGNPGVYVSPIRILPPGENISHLSGIGDDWVWIRLIDFDQDGRIDVMDADHGGHIWFHKNLSTSDRMHFDTVGVKFKQTDGKEIKVGPQEGQSFDFNVLQGARATYAVADFNQDGLNDLIVGDTYGKVRYYENQGSRESPVFHPPIVIGNMGTRLVPDAVDWNNDGLPDVVAASSSTNFQLFLNRGRKARFKPGQQVNLEGAPYGAGAPVSAVDWNGDGDGDVVFSTAYGYSCWVERSFMEHGYAQATLLKFEIAKRDSSVDR